MANFFFLVEIKKNCNQKGCQRDYFGPCNTDPGTADQLTIPLKLPWPFQILSPINCYILNLLIILN